MGTQVLYFIHLLGQGEEGLRSLHVCFPLCRVDKRSASGQNFFFLFTSDKPSQSLSVAFNPICCSGTVIHFSPSLVQQNRRHAEFLWHMRFSLDSTKCHLKAPWQYLAPSTAKHRCVPTRAENRLRLSSKFCFLFPFRSFTQSLHSPLLPVGKRRYFRGLSTLKVPAQVRS